MRISKFAALVSVIAIGFAAAPASQAASKPKPKRAKPVCNLLTDPAGDAAAAVLPGLPADSAMDIVSADVATSTKTLEVALRLTSWSDTDTNAPLGRSFYVLFNAPGAKYPVFLSYSTDLTASGFSWGDLEPLGTSSQYAGKGAATGVIDKAGGVITISVPLATLSSLVALKPGMKLDSLSAATTAFYGAPAALPAPVGGTGLVQDVDTAKDGKTYVVGTPSCVTPTP